MNLEEETWMGKVKNKELLSDKAILEIKNKYSEWEREHYRKKLITDEKFRTSSGIDIKPLYTPADISNISYLDDLSFPGKEPYTRGVYPTMYRGRFWTMRQLAGYGAPEDTNERYRFLLAHGATGINGVFDYPTLRGYDSDSREAEGDCGKGGVAIDSLEDMETLFKDISIEKVSISLVACNPLMSTPVMAMFFSMAEKGGYDLNSLSGTTQNDFLMETLVTTAPEALRPSCSFHLMCDLVEFCAKRAKKWHPVSYTGYNYREAGANAIQEVAIVLANALGTTRELTNRGLEVDSFAPRLSFFFSAHNDFFEEIAKYRAARRIWYHLMQERFKPKNPRSYALRFHVQTAGAALTAQQPLNNIVRAAYHGLAAVLGGAQSLHIDGFDEALCTPSETAALIALRNQQILQYETNIVNVIDPLGGSYYLEHLTNEIEEKILQYINEIETQGGIVNVTETGWLHNEIASSASEYQKAVDSGERKVVGVNCFLTEKQFDLPIAIFRPPETRSRQMKKLEELRQRRNQKKVEKSLEMIRRKCRANENVMEALMDAVKNLATLGEICQIFREEFGIWTLPLF